MDVGFPVIAFPSKRLRFLISQPKQREINNQSLKTPVSFVPMAAISEAGVMNAEETKPLEDVMAGYTFFRNGDVVIAKITPCFENGKGAIARDLINGIGFGTTEIFVLRPSCRIDERFLYYFTASQYFRGIGTGLMYGAGGQKRIPDTLILNIPFPDIPRGEQSGIADFLDNETAEADALVTKYERLIELLEEKRVALISQAVTKGLNANVPTKDSGVEWIGKIPKHWKFQRISRIFRTIGSGTTPPASEAEWYDGDTPFVTTAELRENIVIESARSVTASALQKYTSLRIYPPGTILLAMYGATIGRSAILGIPASVNQACCALGDSRVLTTDFAFKWLQAYRCEIIALGIGGGQPNISQDLVRAIQMPVPPIAEQRDISTQVDEQVDELVKLRLKTESAIALVREHRSALITAAVTGQIDVTKYKERNLKVVA